MDIAVSPYHLTTREPAAMAALLLGDHVITMIPTPFSGAGPDSLGRAVDRVPAYLDMMNSWGWCRELWMRGVVRAEVDGEDAVDDVRTSCRRISGEADLAPLRAFMHDDLFSDEEAYLRAVSRDILRGGPDPAVCVPVSAGLDRFAARHGLIVARSEPVSVAQRAEDDFAIRLGAVAVPMMLQAGGDALERARDILQGPLDSLRDAIDAVAHGDSDQPGGESEHRVALRDAAKTYADEFTRRRDHLRGEDHETQIIEGLVSLTFVRMPSDAVIRASLSAARAMLRRPAATAATTLPAVYDDVESLPVTAMIVRVVGRRNGSAK